MVSKSKIGVAVKAVLFDGNGRILTLRRSETAPSRPLYWDLPGGDLDFGEDVEFGVRREIHEETGLGVQDVQLLDVISGLNDRSEFWVTICYTARPTTTEVVLSYEHDDSRWVTPEEFGKLKASPSNQRFVEKFKCLKNSH